MVRVSLGRKSLTLCIEDGGVPGQFSLSDALSGALFRAARKSAAWDAVFTAQEYTSVSPACTTLRAETPSTLSSW